MSRQAFRGYIGTGEYRGRSVPQSVQQQVIRAYCEKNDLQFLLSATEYSIKDSTLMLDAIKEQNICMYSMFLMPRCKNKRMALLSKAVRFAAENCSYTEDMEETFDLMDLYARNDVHAILSQLNEKGLPSEDDAR
jgi:sporadic carbohydrate cluster protein (TIGR04323 family)